MSRPAFYALGTGGWRDYVTILHLPYTAWHLSYVAIGAALAPELHTDRLLAALAAFALALGVGAHALDELQGRPLGTRIPAAVLWTLALGSIAGAVAIGIGAAVAWTPWLLPFIAVGAFLAFAYNLELFGGRFHSDLWFALAWGVFPLLTGYFVVAEKLTGEAFLAAVFAVSDEPGATRALDPGPCGATRAERRAAEHDRGAGKGAESAECRHGRPRCCAARPTMVSRWDSFPADGNRHRRFTDVEAELDRARNELTRVIREETAASTAEIQRLLARERADSLSRLEEEERKIAEERRRDILERERSAGSELSMKLAEAQKRMEQRYANWSADLDRTHQALAAELKKLAERQKVLIGQAESRLQDDREKIDEAGQLQVTAVQTLREELQRASELAAQELRAELDVHGAERRRALEEMSQRMKTRERQLAERVEREEADVVRRIQARFVDIERRQVEALERTTKQAAGRFAEAAALQFDSAVKSAREDAARRLARELDRAVMMFAREAETVLAERVGQVADTGTQRVEKRLLHVTAGLERQRDEFIASLQQRLSQLELEVRDRLRTLAAEAEAERSVLENRLQELSRRTETSQPVRR